MASAKRNKKVVNHSLIFRQRYFQVLVVVLMMIVISFGVYHKKNSYYYAPTNDKDSSSSGNNLSKTMLKRIDDDNVVMPLIEAKRTVINGMELYYMVPTAAASTIGILVFFHGCNHGGQDMFYLPEDRIVAKRALDRGLAVLSPTSMNRKSGCWSLKRDMEVLPDVLRIWLEEVNLSPNLPRMGMGASSGGAILFSAYRILGFRSMVSYIMATGFSKSDWIDFMDDADDDSKKGKKDRLFPATGYLHMPRDTKRAYQIPPLVTKLFKQHIPTKNWEVKPHPLSPQVCQHRIPELGGNRRSCREILNYIQTHHPDLLDEEYVVLEPYKSGGKWEKAFRELQLDDDPAKQTTKPNDTTNNNVLQFSGHSWLWAALVEEIAVSYGKHEMTAEHAKKVLDFLMEHAGLHEYIL